MSGLQNFDFTLAANQTRDLASEGTYLRYYSGNAAGLDAGILVKADTGALATILYPGQSIKLPDSVMNWRISNYKNAGTITGILVIGNGEIQDTNIAGSVSIINGEVSRVKAGTSFIGSVTCVAVAGQYSHCQLWNPAGSGKNLILNKLEMSMGSTGSLGVYSHNVAKATGPASGFSKFINGAAGVAQLRTENNASALGTLISNFQIGLIADTKDFIFSEPLVIPPGWGVHSLTGVVNVTAITAFQWNEESQ